MSAEALPIDPTAFAEALESLPADALHLKAAEIENTLLHLRSSNAQMLEYADAGDQDCKDAIFENLGVIARMNERLRRLRAEVEKRGLTWPNEETGRQEQGVKVNGAVIEERQEEQTQAQHSESSVQREPSGRLTDEELRRRLEEQLGEDEEGVHL